MTIKQQGGVFGRNPTFNDVTVDGTLTVDGSSTHSGGISAGNISVSGNTIASTNTNGDINLSPNGAGDVVVAASVVITETNNSVTAVDAAMLDWFSDHARLISSQNGVGDGDIQFYVTSAGAVALAGTFTTAGNLAFPSGQGIDFSATAGTGTSELFDDYEEGTWTPVIDSATAGSGRVTLVKEARYTKIGNMVHATALVELTTLGTGGSGSIVINGLPYTSVAGSGGNYFSACSIGFFFGLDSNVNYISATVQPNSTTIFLRGTTAAASSIGVLAFSTYAAVSMELMISTEYAAA
jgi:hypothetical protein